MSKYLIIQTAFLGDAILSLALAEELRRLSPEAHISYLVRPEVAPILKLSPSVDKVLSFDKYGTESGLAGIRKKAIELNAEGFDTIFTLHTSKRTMLLLQSIDAVRKVGYGTHDALTHKVADVREPHTSKAIRLLQSVIPDANLKALPRLVPLESELPAQVRQLPRPIAVISPDSVWETKKWGMGRFRELIELLNRANYSVIITGSSKESTLMMNGNLLNSNIIELVNKTTLSQLVSIIAHADLLISNDSAPVHIATATGTRSIVIYGPTIPEFGFAPPAELGKIIQNEELWCRPCASHGSNECPIHTHECMTSISPDSVFQAVITSAGA